MEQIFKSALAQQFGSTIDMLENAIQACPDPLWQVRLWDDPTLPQAAEFWYIAYHALFWLDLYLTGAVEGFTPPPPFNLDELDPAGLIPPTPYPRDVLLTYLEHTRHKCQQEIETLTEETATRLCRFPWGEITYAGLLLDNLRHVQEHTAQLNLILGQKNVWNPRWITRAKSINNKGSIK